MPKSSYGSKKQIIQLNKKKVTGLPFKILPCKKFCLNKRLWIIHKQTFLLNLPQYYTQIQTSDVEKDPSSSISQ